MSSKVGSWLENKRKKRKEVMGEGDKYLEGVLLPRLFICGGEMGAKKPNMNQHTWMGRKAAEILSRILVEVRAGVTFVSPTPSSTRSSKLSQFPKASDPPSYIIGCPRVLLWLLHLRNPLTLDLICGNLLLWRKQRSCKLLFKLTSLTEGHFLFSL